MPVIEALAAQPLPGSVTLLDGGTPGLETALLLQGYARAIIVDAAAMDFLDAALADVDSERERETVRADWQERHNQVIEAGGLHIIGTERHESRRIDNQLRGRSGRQGDPGSSQFFLSLEDNLLRIFGSERITPWMERLGLEEVEAIEHKMISRAIANVGAVQVACYPFVGDALLDAIAAR